MATRLPLGERVFGSRLRRAENAWGPGSEVVDSQLFDAATGTDFYTVLASLAAGGSFWKLDESSGEFLDTMRAKVAATAVGAPTRGAAGLVPAAGGDPGDKSFTINSPGFDYVDCGVGYQFPGTQSFSAVLVVKPSTVDATFRRILSNESASNIGWNIISHNTKLAASRGDATNHDDAAYFTPLVVGTTYLIVMTYDGAAVRLYLNGVLRAGPTASTRSIPAHANHLRYGAFSGGSSSAFAGSLDALAMIPAALSAAQVTSLYDAFTGRQTVSPSGIASAEAFGADGVTLGGFIHPSGIASAEAVGSPIVIEGGYVHPAGIPSAEAFGTPHLITHQILDPPGIASAESFGLPHLTYRQLVDVAGEGIPSGYASGRVELHSLERELRPPGIPSAAAFGSPTLGIFARQLIHARAIASREAFGDPVVARTVAAAIQPLGIASSATTGDLFVLTDATPTPRNRLVDRQTREVYPWPVNHASEDSLRGLGRQLTRSGVSASGRLTATRKVLLLSQPEHPGPVHLMLHGSFIDHDQGQYTKFVEFFESSDDRTFDYIDAARDSYHVALVGFDARRKMSAAYPDGAYFEYTLEIEVLGVNSGALAGYAV